MLSVESCVGSLSGADIEAVGALAATAARTDGVGPLSEAFLLRMRRGGGTHLLVRGAAGLTGYAQLHAGAAELVVAPGSRHRGVGRALLDAVLARVGPGGPLRMWAHGDHPSATALGHPAGLVRYRVLWQFRRDLSDDVPEPALPSGLRLRAFVPGADEDAWLDVNSRAFRAHPDQGGMTREDLVAREEEPWFDPAGFLLAVDEADHIRGFHWTKVHVTQRPIGEVYVLGIDPDAQARGLGRALTLAGLRHLRGRGLDQVMLYVDEDNPRAVSLYRSMGFTQWITDVAFHRA